MRAVHPIVLLGLLTASVGCAGSRATEIDRLSATVESLQGQLARQSERIEQLSNEVTVLRQAPRASAFAAPADTTPPTALAVVRLEPPRQAAPREAPVAQGHDEEPPITITLHGDGDGEGDGGAEATSDKGPSARELFADALSAFRRGEMSRARSLFGNFLSRYPNDGDADAALYWIGESRYEQGDNAGAARSFGELLSRFPKSPKRADALLKLGLVYERQSEPALAHARFSELVRSYPQSALAELARAHLANSGAK